MKIPTLIQCNVGIPFYAVKEGQYFQFLIFDVSGELITKTSPFFEYSQVMMKVNIAGALDYPYEFGQDMQFIHDFTIVQIVKKTDKVYKNYVREIKYLTEKFNLIVRTLK